MVPFCKKLRRPGIGEVLKKEETIGRKAASIRIRSGEILPDIRFHRFQHEVSLKINVTNRAVAPRRGTVIIG